MWRQKSDPAAAPVVRASSIVQMKPRTQAHECKKGSSKAVAGAAAVLSQLREIKEELEKARLEENSGTHSELHKLLDEIINTSTTMSPSARICTLVSAMARAQLPDASASASSPCQRTCASCCSRHCRSHCDGAQRRIRQPAADCGAARAAGGRAAEAKRVPKKEKEKIASAFIALLPFFKMYATTAPTMATWRMLPSRYSWA